MGEDAVPIDGEESDAVAGTGQEAAIGSESEGVDDIFARRPKLFRCALGADAVDAAGDNRRKGDERLLRRSLAGTRYAARSYGCRALRRGDDGAGSLPGTRLLANRGDVDGAVGGDGDIPNIFCFGMEEKGLLPRSRDPVNLAAGRSADIKAALGVKGDGLCGKVGGIEADGGLAGRIEAKYFRGRPACSVERALG